MKRERDSVRCNVSLTYRYKRRFGIKLNLKREVGREKAKDKNWLHNGDECNRK